MAVDGDIKLSVDLEPGDVTSAAKELQERIREIFKDNAGAEVSQQFQSLQISMASAYNKATRLQDSMTKLATSFKLTPEAKKLENELEKIYAKQNKINAELTTAREKLANMPTYKTTGAYGELQTELKNLERSYGIVNAQIKSNKELYEAGNLAAGRKYLTELAALQKIKAEMAAVTQKMQEMKKNGTAFKDNADAIDKQKKEINKLTENYDSLTKKATELSSKMTELDKAGKARIFGDQTEEYKNLKDQLVDVINKLSLYIRKVEEAEEEVEDADIFGNLVKNNFGDSIIDFANNIDKLPKMVEGAADDMAKTISAAMPPAFSIAFQSIYSITKAAVKFIINEYINTAKQLASVAKQAAQRIATILKTVLIKAINGTITAVKTLTKALAGLASQIMLNPIKKLAESIGNIRKNAQESTPSLKQIGRMFLQYGIGARSLYRLINKLRTALFEGFADLALAYEPFNEAMSMIVTALEYLKNSFAAAFAPIVEYVAPALSVFITKVAEAVQWVGQLIAALTGKEFVMAMPVWKDYAQSTSAGAAAAKEQANADKNAAKAANDAAKAEAKRNKQLEKYKKTIAGFDDVELLKVPDENESTTDGTSPKDYDFSTPTLDGVLQKFTVGGPIQDGIKAFADLIKKAWKTADAYDLGQLVNKQLGNLLKAFNDNIPKIQEFFGRIARVIASFLAGFLSIQDTFRQLGLAIANVINTIFKTAQEFLRTFMNYDGFKNLGKAIYNTIMVGLAFIDWDTIYDVFRMMGIGIAQVLNETIAKPELWYQIFNTLCNAIRALLIRAANFTTTLHWNEIGEAIAYGINTAIDNFPFELLSSTLANFVMGIFSLLYNLITNIHWYELGTKIGRSIVDFVSKVDWNYVLNTFLEFIRGIFRSAQGVIDTIPFAKLGTGIGILIATAIQNFPAQEIFHAVATFINGIFTTLGNIRGNINWKQLGNKIGDDIMSFFRDIKWEENGASLGSFLQGIFDTLKGIGETINFDEIAQDVVNFITGFFSEFDWQDNLDTLLGLLNRLLAAFQNAVSDTDWENIIDSIREYIETSPEVKKFLENVWTTISNIAKAKLDLKWTLFTSLGGKLLGYILKGIADAVKGLTPIGWFEKWVIKPIHDGISDAGNLNSKSDSKFSPLGASMIGAVQGGADGIIAGIGGWAKSHVFDPFHGGLNSAFGIAGSIAKNFTDVGSSAVSGVKSGADSETPQLNTTAQSINTNMQSALAAGDWSGIGSTAVNAVNAGMASVRDIIHATSISIQEAIYNALNSGNWGDIGSNIGEALNTSLSSASETLSTSAGNIGSNIYDAINNMNWSDLGDNISNAIGIGMDNGWPSLADKAWNLAVDLYNTACEALDIGSPSKVFRDKIGEMIPAGIGVGIEANADSALGAVSDLSDSLVNTAKGIKIPPIAMGEVIPYNIANNQDSTQTALNTLADMIQSLQSSMVTEETLDRAIANVIANMPDFYIGQEKLARIVRQGNSMLDRRYGY